MRFLKALCAAALSLGLSLPAAAQVSGEATFNLFELEGLEVSRNFTFDDEYTEQYGFPVSVPFAIDVPQHDEIFMIADGAPDGGAFVKFTFGTETEPRQFLENFQVVTATIPMAEDQDDPLAARIGFSAQLLQENIFPAAVQGFEEPQILAVEAIEFGDVPAVQLVGIYTDPSIGPMALRLTMMLNPEAPESYFTISNINLALVPVNDGPTLAATITGRILNSWRYE